MENEKESVSVSLFSPADPHSSCWPWGSRITGWRLLCEGHTEPTCMWDVHVGLFLSISVWLVEQIVSCLLGVFGSERLWGRSEQHHSRAGLRGGPTTGRKEAWTRWFRSGIVTRKAWLLYQRSSGHWTLAYGRRLTEWEGHLSGRLEWWLNRGSALASGVIVNKPMFWIRPPFPQL